jgi:phage terminase large subunit
LSQIQSNTGDIGVKEAIKFYHTRPVDFVKQLLRATPEPWQENFLNSVVNHHLIAVKSANGVGKTTCCAWLLLWWICTRYPAKVGVTAPGFSQLEGALWMELKAWRLKMPSEFQDIIKITSDQMTIEALGNAVLARTASKDKPEALAGLHSENMLYLVDEASGVDEQTFKYVERALSEKNAKIIMTSNPTRSSGYFYDAFHRMASMWCLMTVKASDSKWSSGDLSELIKLRYGEDSDDYRMSILGEFPNAENDVLIPRYIVQAAIDRTDISKESTAPIYWGVDVARGGSDVSALSKRQGHVKLGKSITWNFADLTTVAGHVAKEFNETAPDLKPTKIYIDSNGIGAGVFDILKDQRFPVIAVNVSESADNKVQFERKRDQLWVRCKEWFYERNCIIEDEDLLVAELTTPIAVVNINGKVKVESKREMKQRGYKSPNIADSFILTFNGMSNIAKKPKSLKKRDYAWVV